MPTRHPRLVLLLVLAAMAGPSVALAQASAEGLLMQVLTASGSRQRTREAPERRPAEDRALQLANACAAQPSIAQLPVAHLQSRLKGSSEASTPVGPDTGDGLSALTKTCAYCAGGMALPNPPPIYGGCREVAEGSIAHDGREVRLPGSAFRPAAPALGPPAGR